MTRRQADAYLLDHRRPERRRQNHICPGVPAQGGGLHPLHQRRSDRRRTVTPELVAASRILLQEIEERIARGEDFAFETTLAGRGYLRLIQRLQQQGWQVELIYLALPSLEMSKLRVAERVAHGGHNIPLKDIERRFARSLRNLLNDYSTTANRTRCFMNTDDKPAPVFELQGNVLSIFNQELYQHLVKEAGL